MSIIPGARDRRIYIPIVNGAAIISILPERILGNSIPIPEVSRKDMAGFLGFRGFLLALCAVPGTSTAGKCLEAKGSTSPLQGDPLE